MGFKARRASDSQLWLQRSDGAPFAHRVNDLAPVRRHLNANDWCCTNDADRSIILRASKGAYKVWLGDRNGVTDIGVRARSVDYAFHPDGVHIIIGFEDIIAIADMSSRAILSHCEPGGRVDSVAFTEGGAAAVISSFLQTWEVDDKTWTGRGRWPGAQTLHGTGTLGLIGLSWSTGANVWAYVGPDGLIPLGQHQAPHIAIVWHEKGRTAICDEYAPKYQTCYEVCGIDEAITSAGIAFRDEFTPQAIDSMKPIRTAT